jgi:hypothetical protein
MIALAREVGSQLSAALVVLIRKWLQPSDFKRGVSPEGVKVVKR